jgi:hypothetical protein
MKYDLPMIVSEIVKRHLQSANAAPNPSKDPASVPFKPIGASNAA